MKKILQISWRKTYTKVEISNTTSINISSGGPKIFQPADPGDGGWRSMLEGIPKNQILILKRQHTVPI